MVQSSTGSTPANEGVGETTPQRASEYVGIDAHREEFDPDDYVGELFQGAHFQSLDVPATAATGGSITITGVVHLDNPGVVISSRWVRVLVESPMLSSPKEVVFRDLKHCHTKPFAIEVPISGTPGQQAALTVKAQSKTYGGWATGETRGPERVNILTQDQKQREDLIKYVPWVVGGAGVGVGYNNLTGGTDPRTYALGGAAMGIGAKVANENYSVRIPEFPTTQVAVVGGALLAATLFLNTTGAGGVLRQGSGLVSDVAGAARSAIGTGGNRR